MLRNALAYSILGGVILCVPHVTAAQSTPTSLDVPPVSIPFLVTDRQGAPVSGITQADIVIQDEKAPPKAVIGIRPARDLPLRLAVLVDDSGSERSNRSFPAAVKSLGLFLPHALADEGRALVIVFPIEPNASEFMDRDQLAQFTIRLNPFGSTDLYDSIALACQRLNAESTKSAWHVLLVLTDGDDDASRTNLEAAIKAIQNSRAALFVVDTGNEKKSGPKLEAHRHHVYKRFAEEAGGLVYFERPAEDMAKVFATIKEQMDSMYLLTYVPAQSRGNGHHSVEIKPASNKEWSVHAARGYDEK